MKSVCIVLKKRVSGELDGENAVLRTFHLRGYSFEELRVLPQSDEKKLVTTLTALRAETENILLLADKSALPIVRESIFKCFSENTLLGSFGNACIVNDKKCSLFLLSSDETETGAGYVQNACVPFLEKKYGVRYEETVLRAVGANEARVQGLLAEIERFGQGKISVRHFRKYDEDVVGVLYDSTASKISVDEAIRRLVEGLGDTVYALNDNLLEEQLVTMLKLRGKKISVAESFTGGGVARRLTSVSGASEVYFEGLNTYDELSKIKRLGVSEYGLRTAGAVSDQTAYEMALGLLNTGDCDLAIATTGLAGPKSDRSTLPVGLCFIAVGTKEKIFVYRYKFDGDRKTVTEKAINYALYQAYKLLKDL